MKKIYIMLILLSFFLFDNVLAVSIEQLSSLDSETTSMVTNQFLLNHPIGSIYETVSSTESTPDKMASKYGGTWVVYGEGSVLRGTTGTVNQTGGSNSVKIAAASIPTLTFSGSAANNGSGYSLSYYSATNTTSTTGAHLHKVPMYPSGSGSAGFGVRNNSSYRDRLLVTGNGNYTTTDGNHSHTYTNRYVTSISGIGAHSHTYTGYYTNNNQNSINISDPYTTVYRYKRTA